MRKEIERLKEGHKVTKEDVKNISKVLKQLEESEERYEKLQKELAEAEQELSYFQQEETYDYIRWIDEQDRRDRDDIQEYIGY